MFRLAIFIIFFAFIFTILVSSIGDNEYVILNISDYIIEINTLFASFLLVIFVALLLFVTKILYTIIDFPKNYKLNSLARDNAKLLECATTALSEIQLGNTAAAKTQINKLKKLQNNQLLAHIIEAQAAIINKNDKSLEQVLNKILKIDSKNSFALNGVGALAFKNGNYKQSQTYLEEAFTQNKKGKNILPALIKSYFVNNEQQKLEKLLTEAIKHHLIKKDDYIKEIALNSFFLAEHFFHEQQYKKADKYISKSYELYPQYFPILKLYIKNLIQKSKYNKARNIILKNWHSYSHSQMISLYEISSELISTKKKLSEIKKLIKQHKMDIFLPVLQARIALESKDEKHHKEAEKLLEQNQHSLEYKIGLEALHKLKEILHGEHSASAIDAKDRILELNNELLYKCSNCGHKTQTHQHICTDCLELASFEEQLFESEELKKLL